MVAFETHTIDSAPEGSKDALNRLHAGAGVIPNLAAAMAEAPSLIDGFVTLRGIYEKSTLSPQEREVLALANAVENGCEWCVAFHSFVATKLGVDEATIGAVRSGKAPADKRAAALTAFAGKLIEARGAVRQQALDDFLAAGFTKQQALDVVTGQAISLMANYAGNIIEPPLDGFLGERKWARAA